jgi:uncharacterized protein (TIGR03545 family)
MPETRPARFRWRALIPLVAFLALVVVGWWLYADRWGRLAVERGGTAVLGARVDVRSLRISLARGAVTIAGLVAASPFDSLQNLVEAEQLVADLDLLPLLEKKVVVDRLAATGLRFGTPRRTSGFVSSQGPGASARVMANVRAWAAQPALQVPLLQLATGTLSVDSLDPRKLQTIAAAESLAARVDSSARAWTEALAGLDAQATADSGVAFAQRLQGAKPTDLALIRDARRMINRAKQTRDRLASLERGVKAGRATLDQGLAAIGAARSRDYGFAKSLVRLPPIDASAIAWVLFGPEAVGKFQRALYYTQLARAYMPPVLRPRAVPAPPRVRRAGLSVAFPREQRLPDFLLRDAELSLLLGSDSARRGATQGRLQGLTSAPALYGRPDLRRARADGFGRCRVRPRARHSRRPGRHPAKRRDSDHRLAGASHPVVPGTGDLTLGSRCTEIRCAAAGRCWRQRPRGTATAARRAVPRPICSGRWCRVSTGWI